MPIVHTDKVNEIAKMSKADRIFDHKFKSLINIHML